MGSPRDMRVNLDQIEFYYGPSRQQSSSTLAFTSEKRPPSARVPQSFQHSFSTESDLTQTPATANISGSSTTYTHEWSSTGIAKPWNAFDVEITSFYGEAATRPQTITENKFAATRFIPASLEAPLDLTSRSLSLSESPAIEDSATPTLPTANELDQEMALSGNIPDAIDAATPSQPMSPAAASDSASNPSSSLTVCDDPQQEPCEITAHKLSCDLDGVRRDRDPCSSTSNAPEQTKVSESGEGTSTPSCQPYQPNARSSPECSASLATPSVNRPESYPSIAVVVPAPPWVRGRVTRTTTRVAALSCKKRLRSSRGADDPQDPEVSISGATRQRPKKPKPTATSLRHSLGGSEPVPCNCSRAMQEVRGRAILTVESSGLKPAYYLTFVPDASPMLTQTPSVDTSGKQKPYTSDENAMLVRLKEREGMPWAEIAAHFPERSASSLQVHYSTKLRHKATTRVGRLRRRR
jgi:hypothetical protein